MAYKNVFQFSYNFFHVCYISILIKKLHPEMKKKISKEKYWKMCGSSNIQKFGL